MCMREKKERERERERERPFVFFEGLLPINMLIH